MSEIQAALEGEAGRRLLRVVIADDQALVRAGFRMILEADIEVVAESSDCEEAIGVIKRNHPDVVLMDIRMPRVDGLEATRRVLREGERCRVLILTTFDLDEYVCSGLEAGASGFMLKDVSPEQLVAAVRTVADGDALLAPSITRRLIERFVQHRQRSESPQLGALTEREREVLVLIARGLSNGELAARLHLGEATVKTHVNRILSKLGLRDRVQAVVMAYETGIVAPGEAAVANSDG